MTDAILNLLEAGYRLQMSGQLEEAERHYRDVLRQDHNNIHALNLLGIVCINTDRAEDAVELITKAIALDPDDAEAHANLGLALKDLHRFDEARASFERTIRINPNNPVTHNNLGNVLAALNRNKEAVASYRSALHLDQNYVQCLSNLAGALKAVGQLPGALAAADRAIELQPHSAQAHNNRGEVLFKQARFAEAADSYRTAVKYGDNYVAAVINLSAALKETGDIEGARQTLDDVIRREPDNPRAYNNLGVLLEQLGDGEQAAVQFRNAIRLSQDYGNAYYQLAQLRGHGLTDHEVDAVTRLCGKPDTTDAQRMPLEFALACAFEDRGDFEQSFRHLEAAQALKAEQNPYDDANVGDYYERIKRVVSTDPLPSRKLEMTSGARPVFVLGMPRSGTTLTEQILGSHPDVYGAGELSYMEDTINEAKSQTGEPFPECVPLLSCEQLDGLGRLYLDRLTARSSGEAVVVDKTPMNFQYIGFIMSILPDARFIHCRRHPIDNCLSIFKLPFEESHSYAHSLVSLGQYYRHYQTLMEHWQTVAAARMTESRYEDVVADSESQSRRLLEFLDLPFDESVLEFHKTDRIVKTPSASQVRQPIYRSSVDRWKKYERFLGPLLVHLKEDRDA